MRHFSSLDLPNTAIVNMKNWRENLELIGLFAVVISIVLLAIETRQTRLAIIGEAYLSRAAIGAESDMDFANSEFLPGIEIKYLSEGYDALTPEERERFAWATNASVTRFDAYLYQYELGLLDDGFMENFIIPNVRFYKQRWIDTGNLETARPALKELVEATATEGTIN